MTDAARENESLRAELAELRSRLADAEEMMLAIRRGEVDAFVVETAQGEQVFTLQTSDRLYRLLVERMPQGAVVTDNECQIVYANKRFAEMIGRVACALIGVDIRTLATPAGAAALERLIQANRTDGERDEILVHRDDGSTFAADVALTTLPEAGRTRCLTVTDLTEQRYFEALRASEERLRETDRRKDEFLAMLAHELRNPLAPVRNGLAVLGVIGSSDPLAEQTRTMIERQVAHMSRLLDDLLDVSRISRGQVQLRRERVEVAAVVATAVESTKPLLASRDHALEIDVPESGLAVDADPTRLAQILVNLLNNAAKYTEPGGKLRVAAHHLGTEAVIRVSDNGIGMSADALPRVFELFTQVDRRIDRSEGGLGIGLSLVRWLVELHGGRVEARSDGPGRGSEFAVRLPLASSAAARPDAGRPSPAVTATPLRILVVDDNADSATSMAMLLGLIGHDVAVAFDGMSALTSAAERRPDVVLLDLGLPGVDGFEVCRHLRANGYDTTRIVAMTGYAQEADQRRTTEAGFDAHLVKPVAFERLEPLLAQFSSEV